MMKIYIKRIRKQQPHSKQKYFQKRMLVIAAMATTILTVVALGQTTNNKILSVDSNKVKKNRLPEKILVIENVSLIDAKSPAVQPNKTVVIVGNRIKAIGEKGKVSIPPRQKSSAEEENI